MTRAAIVLMLLTLAAATAAQRPQFGISTSLVRLEVGVIDDNGPVRGLHPEDFVVEDSAARQVVKVEEYIDAPIDLVLVAPPIPSVAYTNFDKAGLVTAGLSAFLSNVQDRDRLGVVKAGAPPTRLRALEPGRPLFDMQTFSGGNDAAPFDGIAAGLRVFVESDRRRALVAFTNASDFRSLVTFPTLVQMAGRLGPAFVLVGTPVTVVSAAGSEARLTNGTPLAEASRFRVDSVFPSSLKLLARRTGGIAVDLGGGNPAELISQMFTWLRTGYLVSYEPPAGKGWHPVSVKVTRRGARVSVREGYSVE